MKSVEEDYLWEQTQKDWRHKIAQAPGIIVPAVPAILPYRSSFIERRSQRCRMKRIEIVVDTHRRQSKDSDVEHHDNYQPDVK